MTDTEIGETGVAWDVEVLTMLVDRLQEVRMCNAVCTRTPSHFFQAVQVLRGMESSDTCAGVKRMISLRTEAALTFDDVLRVVDGLRHLARVCPAALKRIETDE